ncbi:hypothetical protein [Aneurinibacillus migulanus]|uniref:Nucleoside 2-deoxyribosyltransferase n=1 Tax=Aneurinibacillus migulanus TaxID=47500 RepID=A0A0D1VDB1_ANEMI|nr:hypothetical protein [Aneurinibacillus migulanus]KIV57444.1 hypothetical protein TS65_09375 [Aneurinibacillus migulanus]KON94945.1 hypothetical protein AF333_05050 [Aneurinibacillus migulanus]MED0892767.1 hypothetical protein [Aneurinibacillus migulanus]MED1619013.1 hypothetical protein [Aneurinibacillus migulanus]SDI95082.1 hypothetical protein SAMN04487909_109201 [Aneurinibacillus migulanus]
MKEEKQAFVIMPIGAGEDFNRWQTIYKTLIRNAVEQSGYEYRCIRADEIGKPGSIIKDILRRIYNSDIVIADLTDQNPNVFYELGVRHSLKNNTILIAQDTKFIPFDLKNYRTIIYSPTLEGQESFKHDMIKALTSIEENPETIDSPVIELLPELIKHEKDDQITFLKEKIKRLKIQKGESQLGKNSFSQNIQYILELKNYRPLNNQDLIYDLVEEKEVYISDISLSPFHLYYTPYDEVILDKCDNLYMIAELTPMHNATNFTKEIVMILNRIKLKIAKIAINFIVIIPGKLREESLEELNKWFDKQVERYGIKTQTYTLQIWDEDMIQGIEKSLGLMTEEVKLSTLIYDDDNLPF